MWGCGRCGFKAVQAGYIDIEGCLGGIGQTPTFTTTLMVFDVSKQSERMKSSVVDIQIKVIFNAAVAANTQAYAVLISDKLLKFQSDGQKMSVVY